MFTQSLSPTHPFPLTAFAPAAAEAVRRAIFIDEVGTLVVDMPHNVDPALVRFTDGAVEGCLHLHSLGYALVIVTNQPGVAMGHFDRAALADLQRAVEQALAAEGVPISGFYTCVHAPSTGPVQNCLCRKPAPGLLLQAARAHNLDLAGSWMVGDILDDVEAGRRAGCRTVLLDVGNETEWRTTPLRQPHFRAPTLLAAARLIESNPIE